MTVQGLPPGLNSKTGSRQKPMLARDLQAIWHYARGVAFAAKGDAANADAEASAIDAIEGTADFTLLKASGIPAHEVQDGTAQICPAEVRLV